MKKLKVYSIGWDKGGYGGGLCVVAAHDATEAHEIAEKDGWYCGDHYANEMVGVSYEGEPCVIASDYYQE